MSIHKEEIQKHISLYNLTENSSKVVPAFNPNTANSKDKEGQWGYYITQHVEEVEKVLNGTEGVLCVHMSWLKDKMPEFAEGMMSDEVMAGSYISIGNKLLRKLFLEGYEPQDNAHIKFSNNTGMDEIAEKVRADELKVEEMDLPCASCTHVTIPSDKELEYESVEEKSKLFNDYLLSLGVEQSEIKETFLKVSDAGETQPEVPKQAPKKKRNKQRDERVPTLEEILNMPDYSHEDEIVNFTVLKKVINEVPQDFFIETKLVEGKCTQELTHARAIPIQTAPSLNFYTRDYNSLKDIYTELRKIICDYIAFPTDSLAPDLIALGSVASYFREIYYTYPYFDFISSEPEAGKTTAMKVQTFTSFYGTIASSVTEALLFREIDGSHCFYGLDNIERLFASPKDYASIIDWLLSSYSRDIPCKRLEKTEEGYEVRYFDGYGIKAFTHIQDFPFALRALRSRCIQIVMQSGRPKCFYPSADKFTEIRDALYKARLLEFEAVKESYEKLIDSNVLTGRGGDLYLPLLSIAKLVDGALYTRILAYAKRDEVERIEYDGWNIALISVLLEYKLYGTHSTNEIGKVYEEALRERGLLKKEDSFYTRTVTTRLKKLGFRREEKKTGNKTWFFIDEKNAMSKAYAYNIIDEEVYVGYEKNIEKSTHTHTPPKANFPNLLNFGEDEHKPKEGSTEGSGENKPGTEKIDSDSNGSNEELAKVGKLAKRGVCTITNVCDKCGEDRTTTEYNGEWLCSKCLTEFADNLKECDSIKPEAFDENFQTLQDKEAVDRLGVAK